MMRPQGAIYGWDRLAAHAELNYTRYDKVVEALGGHGEYVRAARGDPPRARARRRVGQARAGERDDPPGPASTRAASTSSGVAASVERSSCDARRCERRRSRVERSRASRRRSGRSRSSTSRRRGCRDDPGARDPRVRRACCSIPATRECATLATLVRPQRPLPRAVAAAHRPQRRDRRGRAVARRACASALREALAGRAIVAHNAEFERALPRAAASAASSRAPPTSTRQDLLALTHPDAPDLRLESFTRIAARQRGAPPRARRRARHRARDGARRPSARARASRATRVARSALESYAPDSPWLALLGSRATRAARREARAFVAIGASERAARRRSTRTRSPPRCADADARARATSRATACARSRSSWRGASRACSRDGGTLLARGRHGRREVARLSRRGDPVRDAQRARRAACARAGRDLDAHEAAPGPAAREGHPGARRASSAIPALRALSIKGRANYVCAAAPRRGARRGRASRSIFPEDRLAYAVLDACARTRPHGEVGHACPRRWLRRYPPLRDLLRRSVAARAEQCTREQCARTSATARSAAAARRWHRRTSSSRTTTCCCAGRPTIRPSRTRSSTRRTSWPAWRTRCTRSTVRPDEVLERIDDVFGRPARSAPLGCAALRGEALLPAAKRRARCASDARAWRRGVQQELVALGRSLEALASEFGEVQVPAQAGPQFAAAAHCAEIAALRLDEVSREMRSRRSISRRARAAVARDAARAARRGERAARCAFAGDPRTRSPRSRASMRRSIAGGSRCGWSRRPRPSTRASSSGSSRSRASRRASSSAATRSRRSARSSSSSARRRAASSAVGAEPVPLRRSTCGWWR